MKNKNDKMIKSVIHAIERFRESNKQYDSTFYDNDLTVFIEFIIENKDVETLFN